MTHGSAKSLLLAAVTSIGAINPSKALASDASAEPVKVYNVEPGMKAPELISTAFSEPVGATCKKKNQAVFGTNLLFIVDSQGQPRNLYFSKATGTDLDKIALRLASADRFKPSLLDGKPVATWAVLETEFQVCDERKKVGGVKVETLGLIAPPIQTLKQGTRSANEAIFAEIGPPDAAPNTSYRVGGGVTPPRPVIFPEAEFSDDARKKKISGVCLVALIVDAQGMPQSPHFLRKVYPSLDQKAMEAVSRYRFKPAMKDGIEPVPVMITIEVNFRLY